MDNLLEKIYSSNPWFAGEKAVDDDIHLRELAENKFIFLNQDFLRHDFGDGVYIATGPRQIGKTTHLKLLIKDRISAAGKTDFLYFNCDLLESKADIADLVEIYLKNFPSRKRVFIMLDEITAVKDSILGIKYLVDKGLKKNITYILTGSSTVEIKKTGEYLPGRRGKGVDFHFAPVGFKEFVQIQYQDIDLERSGQEGLEKYYARISHHIPLTGELDKYFFCGGIPRIVNEYLAKKQIGLENLTLYRDWMISEIIKNGKKENIAKTILARILDSVTSDISYNSFAQDTGLGSHNTVYEYLNFLEDAFIAYQVYNYDYHQAKINFRKNKKIYLADPFLFHLLAWWLDGKTPGDTAIFGDTIIKSRIAENLVFLHLKRYFNEVHFNKNADEIDFICGESAFESKFSNKIATSDHRGLDKFKGRKSMITKNLLAEKNGIKFIPLDLFLLTGDDSQYPISNI